jgi:SAM-dependent methyltransferase
MDGAAPDHWSEVAETWSTHWAASSEPARTAIIAAAGIAPDTRVLDVGCGSGEFLAQLAGLGAIPAGIDPAPLMVEAARRAAPFADVRDGDGERLPWPEGSFEVVTAVNALQFADDTLAALAEFARVLVPGGRIAVANWAEGARNDLDVIERAVAMADDDELRPDGDLRLEGGLERLLSEAGLAVLDSGLAPAPWVADDDADLVRGMLMGEDAATIERLAPTVIAAAAPFREPSGRYRLDNAFRWAVAVRRD